MPSSVKERASSLGTTGELGTSAYNLARGLRAVYCGSAFLPAFVLEECHAALDDIGFDFVRKCVEAIEEKVSHCYAGNRRNAQYFRSNVNTARSLLKFEICGTKNCGISVFRTA
ncbi:unnamed protein product [Gongylonema pulchrum]|uniref:Aminotran_1_2 domain-containing protein n=1 Tax=Gongylonema pulchrum TaxID=637853 RepID=A0A183DC17_9BILA|nr:unnamed protein product [Gongylonema pulchrum]